MLEPPKINYSLTTKVNLGNYENIEVSFGVIDSKRDSETMMQAVDRIKKLVHDVIYQDMQEIKEVRKD